MDSLLLGVLPQCEFAVIVAFEVGNKEETCVPKLYRNGGDEQDEYNYDYDDDYEGQENIQDFFGSRSHIINKEDIIDKVAPDFVDDVSRWQNFYMKR